MGAPRRFLQILSVEFGMAGASTALLICAPVLVASAIAATMVSSARTTTDKLALVSHSALRDVSSGIEQRGVVLAFTDWSSIQSVVFDVRVAGGGAWPLSLDPALDETTVTYMDDATIDRDVPYQVFWISADEDDVLEAGETAQVTVDVSHLSIGHRFTLEMRPTHGLWVSLDLTSPQGSPLDHVLKLR
jgi:archaellin